MESYLLAQKPSGLRMWQTRRAFYPAHVREARAKEDKKLEKLTSDITTIAFGPLAVHTVFPYMRPSDFDRYMTEVGAADLKVAIDEWPANTAKALILMVLSRPALEIQLECVLAMYSDERTRLATRMYEVGLGRCLRQMLLVQPNIEVTYYKLMNPTSSLRSLPLVPVLNHEPKNVTAKMNKFLERCVRYIEPQPAFRMNGKTPDEQFLARLLCASATAKADQWPECWAHSLSALDHAVNITEEAKKRFLHDLFCYVAHSAGRCHIRSSIVFKALEHAHGYMHNLEHPWKRLLVFQDLLVHWGFFTLEEKVFETGLEIIPLKTDYFVQLVRSHLKALMHKTENILLYQHTRQKFHGRCDVRLCKKPQHVAFSFLKVEELTELIDFWSRSLKEPGDREYYSAYVHIYTALRYDYGTLKDGLDHLTQAKFYLDRCISLMKPSYERQKDAVSMSRYLSKNKTNTLEKFTDAFCDTTHMFNNSGGAETLFRIVLLSSYYGTHFYTMQPKQVQKRAAEYYTKATVDRGYRQNLLDMCQSNDNICHSDKDVVDDFPTLDVCMEKELFDDVSANCYWRRELDGKLIPFAEDPKSRAWKRKMTGAAAMAAGKNRVKTSAEKKEMTCQSVAGMRDLRYPRKQTFLTKLHHTCEEIGCEKNGDNGDDDDDDEVLEEEDGGARIRPKVTRKSSRCKTNIVRRSRRNIRGKKRNGTGNGDDNEDEDEGWSSNDLRPCDLPSSKNFLLYIGDPLNYEVFVFGQGIAKLLVQ